MVQSCCFVNCSERDTRESRSRGISFHTFPRNPYQRHQWTLALNRLRYGSKDILWQSKPRDVVCSKHFHAEDFYHTGRRRMLKKDAIPISKRNTRTDVALGENASIPRPSKETSTEEKNIKLEKRLAKQAVKLRNTKKRENRLRRTVGSLVEELDEQKFINEDLKAQLEDFKDLPHQLFLKEHATGTPYSEQMKKFALTLHLYGPKAYEYASSVLPLPSTRTLRKWLFGINCDPGLTGQSFELLKTLRNSDNGWQYDICNVVIDGMSIRSSLEWDHHKGKMIGLVDFGNNIDVPGEDKPAHEALVIMAVGIRSAWKVPLGYFFCVGCPADLQAQLLRNVFDELLEIGVIPISLTLDGMITNVKTVNILGCDTSTNNVQCHFQYDRSPLKKIFVFFDACHCIKNVRNALSVLSFFKLENEPIRWSYIVKLNEVQRKEGLQAGNKLTNAHIHFKNQIMKVRLATQTFSNRVAKGIRLCRLLDLRGFQGSQQTEVFIETMDRLFDILNSHNNFSKSKYKRALNASNLTETRDFLMSARSMILSLKNPSGRRLVETKRSIGFLGFVINIDSVLAIADLVIGLSTSSPIPKMRYLRTYSFSQDHLEIFFSAVRRAGGWNNNPSSRQFQYIYRRFLTRAGAVPSPAANVIPQDCNELVSCDPSNLDIERDDSLDELAFGRFTTNVLTYICGWVVRKALTLLKCADCRHALVKAPVTSNVDFLLIRIRDNGGLFHPNDDVRKIVFLTESVLKTLNPRRLNRNIVMTSVLRRLDLTSLFRSEADHFDENSSLWSNHLISLVKLIVSIFVDLRQHHEAKKWNFSGAQSNVRQILNKTVLFRHQ